MLRILIMLLLLNSLNYAYAFGPDVIVNDIRITERNKVVAKVDIYLTKESLLTNTLYKILNREIRFYEEEEHVRINKIIIQDVYLNGRICEECKEVD